MGIVRKEMGRDYSSLLGDIRNLIHEEQHFTTNKPNSDYDEVSEFERLDYFGLRRSRELEYLFPQCSPVEEVCNLNIHDDNDHAHHKGPCPCGYSHYLKGEVFHFLVPVIPLGYVGINKGDNPTERATEFLESFNIYNRSDWLDIITQSITQRCGVHNLNLNVQRTQNPQPTKPPPKFTPIDLKSLKPARKSKPAQEITPPEVLPPPIVQEQPRSPKIEVKQEQPEPIPTEVNSSEPPSKSESLQREDYIKQHKLRAQQAALRRQQEEREQKKLEDELRIREAERILKQLEMQRQRSSVFIQIDHERHTRVWVESWTTVREIERVLRVQYGLNEFMLQHIHGTSMPRILHDPSETVGEANLTNGIVRVLTRVTEQRFPSDHDSFLL